MLSKLRVRTIGECVIIVGDRRIEPSAEVVFATLLRLALDERLSISRLELGRLLWPDATPGTRASRIRWLLTKLRRLGLPISVKSSMVSLDEMVVVVDVDELTTAVTQPSARILPAYRPTFSPAFAAWLEDQRTALELRALRRMIPALRESLARRDTANAMKLAVAIEEIDSLNEDAALAIADCYCQLGSRPRAVERLENYLREVGEVRPELQVKARLLLRRIRRAERKGESGEPQFVGRTDQLRRLEALLAGARTGCGGAFALTGVAGIGKTRLLDETRSRAAVSGMQVVRVRCQRADVVRPLSGIADLIPQLLDLRGAAGVDPNNLAHLRRLSCPVAGVAEPAERPTQELAKTRLVAALFDVLASASAEAPVLVQIDDAQWMDRGLDWLWEIVFDWSRAHGVAWIMAVRTSRNDTLALDVPVISVGSLELPFAEALIDDLARSGTRPVTPAVRHALLARAAGSPLFIRELVRQWVDTADIDKLPSSLSALLDHGLSRMSRHALRVLQAASLLGTHSTLERLECIAGIGRGEFIEALAELDETGILTADRAGFTYGHVLWGEAALALLPDTVASVLHSHAAERFDGELAERPDAVLLWQCARHWERAGQTERARAAIVRGARYLFDNGFPLAAASVYERAAAMSRDGPDTLMLLRSAIDVLDAAGEWNDLVAIIDRHERLAVELDPTYDSHNDLELMRVEAVRYKTSDRSVWIDLPLACARNEQCGTSHRLRAVREAAKSADFLAPPLITELHAIALGLIARSPADRWNLLRVRFIFERRWGDIQRACTVAEDLQALALEMNDSLMVARARCCLGEIYAVAGRFGEAFAAFDAGLVVAIQRAFLLQASVMWDHLIGLSLEIEKPVATRAHIERARAQWEPFGTAGWSVVRDVVMPGHLANLAVLERRFADALELAPPLDECLANPVPRWRRRLLASHMGARIGLNRLDRIGEIAERLGGTFECPDDWMDWPASVYADYLERFVGLEEAAAFARRFVGELRRELYPAPPAIASLAWLDRDRGSCSPASNWRRSTDVLHLQA